MNAIESIRYNNGNFFKKAKRQMTEGEMAVEIQLSLLFSGPLHLAHPNIPSVQWELIEGAKKIA